MIDLIRQSVAGAKVSSELLVPGFVWRSALLCTVLYYYLVHWAALITAQEGLALIRTILVRQMGSHCIISWVHLCAHTCLTHNVMGEHTKSECVRIDSALSTKYCPYFVLISC